MTIELAEFDYPLEGTRSATSEQLDMIESYLERYLKLFGSRSMPKVSVHNNLNSPWLGRTVWYTQRPQSTEMQFQKSILQDPRTLERVVAHEVVHHVHFTSIDSDNIRCIRLKQCKMPPGHGEEFFRLAKVVNDAVGDDSFVTEKSDETYVVQQSKAYRLLVAELNDSEDVPASMRGKYAYAWSGAMPRSPRVVRWIQTMIDRGARLTTTTNVQFARRGPRFGQGLAVAQTEELQQALRDAYRNAR